MEQKPIEVDVFQTEHAFDSLYINNVEHHGYILSSSQDDITGTIPTTNIIWTSDYSANNVGWKICILITSTTTTTETTFTTETSTTTPIYVCTANPDLLEGHMPDHVAFCLAVEGVDFLLLTGSEIQTNHFLTIIKEEVAAVGEVDAEDIEVRLFAGSVISEVTIHPNVSKGHARCDIFNKVFDSMEDGSLEASIQAREAADSFVGSAATGTIAVPMTGNHTRYPDGRGCLPTFPLWGALLLALLLLCLLACLLGLLWMLRKMWARAKLPERTLPPLEELPPPVEEIVEEEEEPQVPVYDPPPVERPHKGNKMPSVYSEMTPSEAPTADPEACSYYGYGTNFAPAL
jgi:hypothetical protein